MIRGRPAARPVRPDAWRRCRRSARSRCCSSARLRLAGRRHHGRRAGQVAYLFSLLAFPIRAIGWVLGDLPRVVVGWDRVQRVLQAEGGQEYGTCGRPAPAGHARRHRRRLRVRAAGRPGGRPVRRVRRGGPAAGPGAARRLLRRRPPAARSRSSARPAAASRRSSRLLVRLVDPDTRRGPARRRRPARAGPRRAWPSRPRWSPSRRSCSTTPCAATSRSARTLDDEQVWAALRLAQADRFVDALPARAGHPDRRARHHPVRRAAAAARAGPRAGPAPAAARARRRHLQRRPARWRRRSCAGLRSAELRRHRRRGRLPAGDDRARRRGRLHRARPGRSTAAPHEELLGRTPGYALLVNAYDDEAERRAGLVAAEEAAR